MVTINNEDLRDSYYYLMTIENIVQKEIRQVRGNKYHLDKMVPSILVKVYSLKEERALAFVDNITRTTYESALIALVATFERVVFAKYRTAYGTIKNVIKAQTSRPLAYFDSRERFVNDNIEVLAGIIFLLDGIVDKSLIQKLNTIKNHRNFIAHGKRDSEAPAVEFTLEEVASTLDDVIREIEK